MISPKEAHDAMGSITAESSCDVGSCMNHIIRHHIRYITESTT